MLPIVLTKKGFAGYDLIKFKDVPTLIIGKGQLTPTFKGDTLPDQKYNFIEEVVNYGSHEYLIFNDLEESLDIGKSSINIKPLVDVFNELANNNVASYANMTIEKSDNNLYVVKLSDQKHYTFDAFALYAYLFIKYLKDSKNDKNIYKVLKDDFKIGRIDIVLDELSNLIVHAGVTSVLNKESPKIYLSTILQTVLFALAGYDEIRRFFEITPNESLNMYYYGAIYKPRVGRLSTMRYLIFMPVKSKYNIDTSKLDRSVRSYKKKAMKNALPEIPLTENEKELLLSISYLLVAPPGIEYPKYAKNMLIKLKTLENEKRSIVIKELLPIVKQHYRAFPEFYNKLLNITEDEAELYYLEMLNILVGSYYMLFNKTRAVFKNPRKFLGIEPKDPIIAFLALAKDALNIKKEIILEAIDNIIYKKDAISNRAKKLCFLPIGSILSSKVYYDIGSIYSNQLYEKIINACKENIESLGHKPILCNLCRLLISYRLVKLLEEGNAAGFAEYYNNLLNMILELNAMTKKKRKRSKIKKSSKEPSEETIDVPIVDDLSEDNMDL